MKEATLDKYVIRVRDLYCNPAYGPVEDGPRSSFQQLVFEVWEIFKYFPNDEEEFGCELLEIFLNDPICFLSNPEPRFLEATEKYFKSTTLNWGKLL